MAERATGKASRWQDFLEQEGYAVRLQVRADAPERARLVFEDDGVTFRLHLDGEDPHFAALTLTVALGDVAGAAADLLSAAHAVTRDTRGAKAWVDTERRELRVHLEWFSEALPSPKLFRRMLTQVGWSAGRFFELVREQERARAAPAALA